MTNVSSLYNFRSVIKGSAVNAGSASRAVRNALKRYAAGTVKLEDITIQHKVKAGPNGEEWQTSASGMELLHKNAAAITPATPKERSTKAKTGKVEKVATLSSEMSYAAKVMSILKSREELTPDETEILKDILARLNRFLNPPTEKSE